LIEEKWSPEEREELTVQFLQYGVEYVRYPSWYKTVEEIENKVRYKLEVQINKSTNLAKDMHQKMMETEDKNHELIQAMNHIDLGQQIEGKDLAKQRNILQRDAQLLDRIAENVAALMRHSTRGFGRSVEDPVTFYARGITPHDIQRIRSHDRFRVIANETNLNRYFKEE